MPICHEFSTLKSFDIFSQTFRAWLLFFSGGNLSKLFSVLNSWQMGIDSFTQNFFTNFYTAAQSHSVSCFFHLHTQHQVAVAANHSSHKHALYLLQGILFLSLCPSESGTLSHKTFKHIPTAPHSGKPLNSTGQHIGTQPHKTFPYHSLLPSLNY